MNKDERIDTLFNFILSERFVTLTVLGSIFTFAFVSSLKNDLIDPLLHIILPEEFFGFMDIVLRSGEKPVMPPRQVEIRMGNFFREFITWIFLISVLYVLAKYTRFPSEPWGNPGVAVV
jgi:large-conductance mechanosensitive channel